MIHERTAESRGYTPATVARSSLLSPTKKHVTAWSSLHFPHQTEDGWLLLRGDEDPACLEIATTNATVSIVNTDGESLEMGPLTLGFVNRSPEMSWTPSGNLLLSDFETTYRIAGQEWDLSPLPGCFEPAT